MDNLFRKKHDWEKTRLEYLRDKSRELNIQMTHLYDRSSEMQDVESGNWFAKLIRVSLRRHRFVWNRIKKLDEGYDHAIEDNFIHNMTIEYRLIIREAILSGWPVPDHVLASEGLERYMPNCKPRKKRKTLLEIIYGDDD